MTMVMVRIGGFKRGGGDVRSLPKIRKKRNFSVLILHFLIFCYFLARFARQRHFLILSMVTLHGPITTSGRAIGKGGGVTHS